jgi:AraC-like DNA-binding protein
MTPTWQTSGDFDFQLSLGGDGSLTRQASGLLPGGAYWFEDTLALAGILAAEVITCTAWLLECYALDDGEVVFRSGSAEVRPGASQFACFYPPFALSRPCLHAARGRVRGLAATAPLPPGLSAGPVLFAAAFDGRPASLAAAFDLVRRAQPRQPIDACPAPASLSRAAKQLIDENVHASPGIGRVAARLGVTHAHLTRQFKRDFGLTPSAYLHQLRLADAPLRLALGQPILDVSHEVGYNDLSRFYKQFRQRALATPGACQALTRPPSA